MTQWTKMVIKLWNAFDHWSYIHIHFLLKSRIKNLIKMNSGASKELSFLNKLLIIGDSGKSKFIEVINKMFIRNYKLWVILIMVHVRGEG